MRNCIAAARETLGISREQLAADIGVSVKRLIKWETGASNPSINEMVLIANRFQLPMDFLLCRDEAFKAAR